MQVQWVGKIHWRREWQSTAVLLPGESHRQRSLVGYSPWGHKEADRLKRLSMHAHPGGKRQGKGTGRTALPRLTVSGFMLIALAFRVISGQSFCLYSHLVWLRVLSCLTCIFQPRWILAWEILGVWLILWAGISSLILAPPKFSWLVFYSNTSSTEFLIGWNLLLWDSSRKQLLSHLAKVGSFSQQFPNSCFRDSCDFGVLMRGGNLRILLLCYLCCSLYCNSDMCQRSVRFQWYIDSFFLLNFNRTQYEQAWQCCSLDKIKIKLNNYLLSGKKIENNFKGGKRET